MRYRDIALTDFGIYQNARIDDLPAGIGVIAGPQRAGKTTFMQALRKLPYGISRGDRLPAPSHEYDLGATIENEQGGYTLRLTGQQAPRIGAVDGAPQLSQTELVGGLTKDQYQQLFTLSLRELQQMPASLDDEEQLSEILLGAAYGDISVVPSLRDRFASEAKTIGGKRGRASYQLGTVVEQIETAVDNRKAAKQTIEEYEERQATLEELEEELAALDATERALTNEQTRLSILDKFFDELERYRTVEAEIASLPEPSHEYPSNASEDAAELESDLHTAMSDVANAQRTLASFAHIEDVEAFGDRVLEVAPTINRYDRQIEKWRNQEEAITARERELTERKSDLRRRVESLRSDWSTLEDVRSVAADSLTRERVRERTSKVESLRQQLEESQQQAAATRREVTELESSLETAETELEGQASSHGSSVRQPLIGAAIALLGLVIGAGAGIASSPLVGYLLAAGGVVAGFLYTAIRLRSTAPTLDAEPVRELKASIATKKSEVAGLEDDIETYRAELEAAETDLGRLRSRFSLDDEVSPSGVREFYDGFESLQQDIKNYDDAVVANQEELREFAETLTEVATDIEPIAEFEWDSSNPRRTSDHLFAAIERSVEAAEAAKEYSAAQAALDESRHKAIDILAGWSSSDRARYTRSELEELSTQELIDELEAYGTAATKASAYRELEREREGLRTAIEREFDRQTVAAAFEPLQDQLLEHEGQDTAESLSGGTSDESVRSVSVLQHLTDQYPTADAVASRRQEVDAELDDLQKDREELRDRRAEINETLKTLASDADLKAAERDIQRHREQLQSLGESYAVHRLAESLLDELHDQFLDEATGPLLDDASDIFSRLTETYDGVGHAGDLDSLEFEALRPDGSNRGPEHLSRATAEQLFLSIRLARIRQFEHQLPVVIDDAMTNFDPAHTRRTLGFLEELSNTHQILLLTCHPEVIRLADDVADVDGYWQLDDGLFDGPSTSPDPALQLLNGD